MGSPSPARVVQVTPMVQVGCFVSRCPLWGTQMPTLGAHSFLCGSSTRLAHRREAHCFGSGEGINYSFKLFYKCMFLRLCL